MFGIPAPADGEEQRGQTRLTRCFVVMPISTPEVFAQRYGDDGEHFKHVLDHLFVPALQAAGYSAVPPAAGGSDLIQAEIIRNLEECDLVLCDISTGNPNVFFELGIRTSLDRPVVLVRDNFTTKIPFDTGSVNTYKYDASLRPWKLETEVAGLTKHVMEAVCKSDGRNPLWRYFGLTQRATPATITNPTEAKLDLIIEEIFRMAKAQATRQPPPSPAADIGERAPVAFSPSPQRIFARGDVAAKRILSRVDKAEPGDAMPERCRPYVARVTNVVAKNGAAFVHEFYDSNDDVLFLDTGAYVLTRDLVQNVLTDAGRYSLNLVLRTRLNEDQKIVSSY